MHPPLYCWYIYLRKQEKDLEKQRKIKTIDIEVSKAWEILYNDLFRCLIDNSWFLAGMLPRELELFTKKFEQWKTVSTKFILLVYFIIIHLPEKIFSVTKDRSEFRVVRAARIVREILESREQEKEETPNYTQ